MGLREIMKRDVSRSMTDLGVYVHYEGRKAKGMLSHEPVDALDFQGKVGISDTIPVLFIVAGALGTIRVHRETAPSTIEVGADRYVVQKVILVDPGLQKLTLGGL